MPRFTLLVALAFVSSLLAGAPAFADDPALWQLKSYNFNQGNRFSGGSAVDEKFAIAFGQEAGQKGNNPVIKRTLDGGKSFSPLTLPAVAGAMFTLVTDVHMFSAAQGLAIGMAIPGGAKFWSVTNKGGTFTEIPVTGAPDNCMYLSCGDASNCCASCSGGKVACTHNGGTSWSFATLDRTDLTAGPIDMLDPLKGMLTLYSQEEITDGQGNVTGYRTEAKGTIYTTANGGGAWTKKSTDQLYTYSAIEMVDADTAFLGASNDTRAFLLKTTNGGTTWDPLPVVASKQGSYGTQNLWLVGGIHFSDAQNGWAALSYGTSEGSVGNALFFVQTTTGGQQWTEYQATYTDDQGATQTASGSVFGWSWVDEHLAYAFGDLQAVYVFDDGQHIPIADGDVDNPDSDQDGVNQDGDVDEDTETGPLYDGGPEDPCPIPGRSDTFDYPRCDAKQNSGLCAWKDGHASFCTRICQKDSECRSLNPDALCKAVTLDGVAEPQTRICLFEPSDIVDYSGNWSGYEGALLGEGCFASNFPDKPRCDIHKEYGGEYCIQELAKETSYCSRSCVLDEDCAGGFQTTYCCNGVQGSVHFCRYGVLCAPEVDGDSDVSEEDTQPMEDGDTSEEITADGDDDTASNATGGGGCASAAQPAFLFSALLIGMALRRRRA